MIPTIKNLLATAGFITLMFVISAFVYRTPNKGPVPKTFARDDGFAVLELFTSEGCSSCPPADELMGQIRKEYEGQPVYILSYHVDYWNRQGWKDRFSSSENSRRQQQYSRSLGSQVYTPQLVINGRTELVGSDKKAVEDAIQKALFSFRNVKIELSVKVSSEGINVNYKTEGNHPGDMLLITLVKKESSTHVGGGENEGRYLQHWQIVHRQNQISLKGSQEGTTHFQIPEKFQAKDWEIIGLLQNTTSGEILGSGKASLD